MIYFSPKQYKVPSWLPITSRPAATAGEASNCPPPHKSRFFRRFCGPARTAGRLRRRRKPARRRPLDTNRPGPAAGNFQAAGRRSRERHEPVYRGRRRSPARRHGGRRADRLAPFGFGRSRPPLASRQSMAKNVPPSVPKKSDRPAPRACCRWANRSRRRRFPRHRPGRTMCSLPSQPATIARPSTTVGEQRIWSPMANFQASLPLTASSA